jgi:MarR family transcriptional regulator, transcriptional regulator for hemolysin
MSDYDKPPDCNVGFLMQDVARLMRRDFNRRVQDLELTQAQWRALSLMWRQPGMRQCDLAETLEMQPISVARLIDRLQAAGWVERKADPKDRRASRLYLTERSEPILTKLRKNGADVRAAALAGVSDKERQLLVDILTRMRANMTADEKVECVS